MPDPQRPRPVPLALVGSDAFLMRQCITCGKQMVTYCLGKLTLSWPASGGGERRIEVPVCEECQDHLVETIKEARAE